MTPRGIRNNNPLNIRRSANKWQGKLATSTDPAFEQFNTLHNGIRAAFRIINTYCERDRRLLLRSDVQSIIRRWAPPSENDTARYIEFVCRTASLKPDTLIRVNDRSTLVALVHAMAIFECGVNLPKNDFFIAYAMAFNN